MKTEPGENVGPVWRNVFEMVRELEVDLGGRVVIEMGAIVKSQGALSVDASFRRVRHRSDWYNVAYVVGRYPSHRAKTMPGMVVAMLWELRDLVLDFDARPIVAQSDWTEGLPPLPPQE